MERDPARPRVRQNGLALIGLQEVWHGAPVAVPGGLAALSVVLLAAVAIARSRARRHPAGPSPGRTGVEATLRHDDRDPVGSRRERTPVQLRLGSGSS